jgi:hypothetical protein
MLNRVVLFFPRQDRVDIFIESGEVDWLFEKAVQVLQFFLGKRLAAHEYNVNLSPVGSFQSSPHFSTVHNGHSVISEDQLRNMTMIYQIESFGTMLGGSDVQRRVLGSQHVGHELGAVLVVIYNKYIHSMFTTRVIKRPRSKHGIIALKILASRARPLMGGIIHSSDTNMNMESKQMQLLHELTNKWFRSCQCPAVIPRCTWNSNLALTNGLYR